jgi:tether containing UBX domain for GLUT4
LAEGGSGSGRMFYEQPVLNIMGRELATFADLQKNLAQLGLNSGSSLIRLSFRKTDTPLEEAMAEIDQYFKAVEGPENAGAHSGPSAGGIASTEKKETLTNAIAGEPNPEVSTATDADPQSPQATTAEPASEPSTTHIPDAEPSSSEMLVGPAQRSISVFAAPKSTTPSAALRPHNESDYEPTIAHAQLHQSRLLASSHNKRLLSDAELAKTSEERAAKQAAIKEVSIKIRFPDQLSIVSTFTAQDTAAALYEFARGVLAAGPEEPFTLVWMGPKGVQTVPKGGAEKLIRDLGFEGRMLLNFTWDEGASETARKGTSLKEEFAGKARDIQVQEPPAVEVEEKPVEAQGVKRESGGKEKGKGGVPKWLKLGKK